MESIFNNISIHERQELLTLLDICSLNNEWYYRGHSKNTYILESTFERSIKYYYQTNFLSIPQRRVIAKNYKPNSYKRMENRILLDFKKRAHLYYPNINYYGDDIALHSLIRHYGGPSRLLDFTRSFMISLFFSKPKNNNKHSSIWCINGENLIFYFKEKYPDVEEIKNIFNVEDMMEKFNNVANNSINNTFNKSAVIPIIPNIMNPRLSIQNGIFLFPCKIEESFNDNLCNMLDMPKNAFKKRIKPAPKKKEKLSELMQKSTIIKINIKSTLEYDVLNILNECNINPISLFPDIEGFVKSLYYTSELTKSILKKHHLY